MELAGLILRAKPGDLAHLRGTLASVRGLEIHLETPDGRLIATLEGATHTQLKSGIEHLQAMDRLLSVAMVYQYSEQSEQSNGQESSA